MKPSTLRHLLTLSSLCALALAPAAMAEPAATSGERPVIDIQEKKAIKVVFQITSGSADADGLNKGLSALEKTFQHYLKIGVAPEELSIHAVIHGDAADSLLTDEAWNRVKKTTTGNPSTALVDALSRHGVHVELCNSRRVINGWEKADIHPGVALVANAFHRLAELQQQGHAYIRL